jgi:hypothetical protein
MPPISMPTSKPPHWSQKGSYILPHSARHMSLLPGYQSSGHSPLPPLQPARQEGSVVTAVRWLKRSLMLHAFAPAPPVALGGLWPP